MRKDLQKTALVHEYFNQLGGAERVVLQLAELFPEAPIYTLFITPAIREKLPLQVESRIRTSFLQRFPQWMLNKRLLFPLYPIAIEQFDFGQYTTVISSSSAYAKGIITRPQTKHVCYCHSPTRYLWDWYHNYLDEQPLGWISKKFLPFILGKIRLWDHIASKRVDFWLANSSHVQKRIKKYYQAESTVVYPPVPVKKISANHPAPLAAQQRRYFLIVSRLSAYKKLELAIEACNRLGVSLKIAGIGRELERLQQIAGEKIAFLGRVSDE
ncbi:MAG: glycosyltransferase, partial [bacterium]